VIEHAETAALLERHGLSATPRQLALRGLGEAMAVYEIP
jgi:hypothetical protein